MAKAKTKYKPVELPAHLAGIPDKPDTIKNDDVASETWDAAVTDLQAQNVLAKTDRFVLMSLCCSVSRLVKAREILAVEDWIQTNKTTGSVKSHVMLQIESVACRDIHSFATELGLSPIARSKITQVETPNKKQSMDDFLDAD